VSEAVRKGRLIAFVSASVLGATSGSALEFLYYQLTESHGDAWSGVVVGPLVLDIFTVPFCALGLGVFGIPLTRLAEPYLQSVFFGPFAIILGAMLGGLGMHGVTWLLTPIASPYPFPLNLGVFGMGAPYGACTAFWWWLFYRRVLARRAALEA